MNTTFFDVMTKRPAPICKTRDGVQLVEDVARHQQLMVVQTSDWISIGGIVLHRLVNTFSNGVQVLFDGLRNGDGEVAPQLTMTLPAWQVIDLGEVWLPKGVKMKVSVANAVLLTWSEHNEQ